MIPPAFLADLLARVDIVEVVGRHVQLKRGGANFMGLCPFHGEKSPSFSVSPAKQFYHCFGCGAHGNAIGFLMEQSGLGFLDAVRDLAQQVGMTVPQDDVTPEERAQAARLKERQGTLTDTLARAARHYRAQLKASPRAIDYLKRRGLSGEIAARFGLGYAPDGWRPLANGFPQYDDPLLEESGLVIAPEAPEGADPAQRKRYDRFRDRVMFPIRSVQGEVIGFGGRVLDRGEPKYLNSPETPVFSKGRELYGLYEARQALRQHGFVLVVEGYMDVVALAQLGFANAVATLGTACTAEHVQKLFRFTDSVVFSFDGDAAGRRAATRALEAALPHARDTRSVRFLFLPAEHDPDSYVRAHGAEAFARFVDAAVPLSRQLLDSAAEGCDTATPEGRAHLLANARPLWTALPDGALKAQLFDELATRGGLQRDDLRRLWQLEGADRRPAGPARADAPPWARPAAGRARRQLVQGTATLLDRALWILLHDPLAWDHLDGDDHALLAEQAVPYGAAFALIERRLHDAGPEAAGTLLAALREQDPGPATGALAGRVEAFVPPLPEIDLKAELRRVLDGLELQAVNEELKDMFEVGSLSEDASRRSRELIALRARLKGRLGAPAAA